MATMPSGVRMEFVTSSRVIELEVLLTGLELLPLNPAETGRLSGVDATHDLVIDGGDLRTVRTKVDGKFMVNRNRIDESEFVAGTPTTIRFDGLPGGNKRCELWLPASYARVEVRALRVEDGATIAVADVRPQQRWMHYGSSISHCSGAHSPTQTWPAVAARLADVDLMSLGLGGSCHLDPFVARTMRDEAADLISLKVGINIHGAVSLTTRTFGPALHGFLDTVRDGKPLAPIVVISSIFAPNAEDEPGPRLPDTEGSPASLVWLQQLRANNLTLRQMRRVTQEIVEQRRDVGDRNLHYVDGLTLFGANDVQDLPDGVHPSADGYLRMGERFFDCAFAHGRPFAVA